MRDDVAAGSCRTLVLVFRDGGCRYPGCDRPPEWTDAHHIVHWTDGGVTSLINCVLVCRHHHTLVHEHGQQIILDRSTGIIAVHDHQRRLVGTSQPRRPHPGARPTSRHRAGQAARVLTGRSSAVAA